MDKKKTLEDIFNDDDLGILDSKAKVSNIKSENERLIDSFQEINAFFEKNKREPKADVYIISERTLGVRLKGIRNNPNDTEILKPYDTNNLLGEVVIEINSVDDILNDDILGILDTDETLEIFKIKNVPSLKEREEADFVARRKPIKDKEFASYDSIFKKVHRDLKEGKRKIIKYEVESLKQGAFYILDGILMFLEKADIKLTQLSEKKAEADGRTRCIFENGTVSEMKFRSLKKMLSVNGRTVTHNSDTDESTLINNANAVNEEDLETGWIYILKSKSQNKSIAEIKDLYKIGFSRVEVKERIKNAINEPTYLMGEVQILYTYKCYNLNPHKFEQLIHRFFAEVCLNVDIIDDKGRRITPREWFVAPLEIIGRVIELILSGDIIKYKYDIENKSLLKLS